MSGCLHGVEATRCVECSSSLRRAVEELQALADANPMQGKEWERPEFITNDGSIFAALTPAPPDRCPTCGSDDRTRVRAGCEYWKDDTLAHPWHQGSRPMTAEPS